MDKIRHVILYMGWVCSGIQNYIPDPVYKLII